jgi:hypothetical protein
MSGDKWTDQEYRVVIESYCQMWLEQKEGRAVNVAQAARDCANQLNNSRSYHSVRMRFSNIACVFMKHNLEIVKGVKSLEHITDECSDYMWDIINESLALNG